MKLLLVLIRVLALLPVLVALLSRMPALAFPYVRVERPFVAALGACVVLVIAARLARLSKHQHPLRRGLQAALLGCAAISAAYAAAGIEIGRPLDRLAIIIALDRSRSIDLVPDVATRIAQELRVAELGMREHDRIGTIAFGASAAVEDPLRSRSALPAPQKAEIARDGTDIGAAIERALGEVPADASARIVLLTDGVATRGDALGDAAAAVAAGVPVDAIPLDQAKVADVRVVGVRTTPRANEGEALDLRVVTESSSAANVELRVFRNGELIRQGTTAISAGEDVVHLREIAPGPGFYRYTVELSAQDPKQDLSHEDNQGSAFVRVRGEAVALVLERDPALAQALAKALEAAAFRVQVAGPSGVPAGVAELAVYDLIALSDISAAELAPSQLTAFGAYVRDLGGGLLLMGGDRSFGPGGYGKTPIEEVSPVAFDLKEERRRASLAEVIAVDYSGSMAMSAGSNTKLELANEAAVRSAELLGAGDRLGIMHVDTAVRWTVALGPVSDKPQIARQIRAVGPGGGGIYVDLALRSAYAALAKERVQLKHVLLFSDGNDAEERGNAFALVSSAKARGITTSVVALGKGSDVPALERMSQLGTGRFYLIEDASRLPAVFAQETILAARSAINEVAFRPALGDAGPATRGIDFAAAPPLTGYVVTLPKGRAQVHLRGPEGDPILATWSAGIGRVAAFTSDYKDRWGAAWTGWAGASKLFGQLGRDIARRADNPRVRVEADTLGGDLRVRASVVDEHGRAENFRRLEVRVAGPDGSVAVLPLEATGAGAYAASVPLSRPGAYVVTATDEQTHEALGTTGAELSAGEELRPTGTDRGLLTHIASLTGGKVRDTLAGIFEDREAYRFAYDDISGLCLLLAACGLLFGVAARRLALPDFVLRAPVQVRQYFRSERVRERARAEPSPAAGHGDAQQRALEALRQKKARSNVVVHPSAARAPASAEPPPSSSSMPRFSRPPEPPAALDMPDPSASATAGATATGPASARNPRALTAAEILLARRRGKRSL